MNIEPHTEAHRVLCCLAKSVADGPTGGRLICWSHESEFRPGRTSIQTWHRVREPIEAFTEQNLAKSGSRCKRHTVIANDLQLDPRASIVHLCSAWAWLRGGYWQVSALRRPRWHRRRRSRC